MSTRWEHPKKIKCHMHGYGSKYFPCIKESNSRFTMMKSRLWCYGTSDKKKKCPQNKGNYHRIHSTWEWLCVYHYLEANYGISTFECTDKCFKDAQSKTDVQLNKADCYTYVPLGRLYAVKAGHLNDKKHPMAFKITCWNCGREFK